jgi:hypothetical protein
VWPRKNGKKDWQADGHFSRVSPPTVNNPSGPFYLERYEIAAHTGWVSTGGGVYQLNDFYDPAGLFNQPPDTCWYNGVAVPLGTQIPAAANSWWYDSGANVVYLRTPGSDDLTVAGNAAKAYVFDWRPFTNEILAFETHAGALTWRRFAHIYNHPTSPGDFYAENGGNASQDCRAYVFASRWGGPSRSDLFLLAPSVPPQTTQVPIVHRRAGAFA